jgi:VWFA-related protein
MTVARFFCTLFTASICGLTMATAQQTLPSSALPAVPPAPHGIRLDVVVDTKSGQPVPSLRQQDFTLLDNKTPLSVRSFRVVTPAQEPVRVILLLDAVNTPFHEVASVRQQVETFLKSNGGTLAQPTTIAILTDHGTQIQNRFSTNGVDMSDDLDRQQIGLREIQRDSQWSGDERFQLCLTAYNQLINFAAALPGRKIVLWISPGWPLISGPGVDLTAKQQQELFSTIVSFSTRLRDANMTLYNINPVGVMESLERTDYYQVFLKGIAKPGDAMPGNLGVQVLAVQSGGLATESDSDVTGMIRKCLTDVSSWYEITFDPPPSEKPNEYHHIEIKLDQRDVSARTRDGYYANPTFIPQR